ncbi:metal ABC transporter permease [Propionibacterium freudenreichii]|uniref:metal ABC transporter permease n=1 Tax=Propionibacterium freudenreichii TaxID=1744 RepID=UPI0005A5C81D|nr:metal ABC transporter permease [Propionibacterium freudenreichii]MCT2976417.1 metal ABC transporter permease [Propionibacterium freudenreichii]MCT2980432.1 metal ABC transporter permease [Propionibacterium freudenreichii]MCT3013076.1 metal ABC transporter permease [Propionibacterium freudenreichii]MDK9319244.1 metal ABC transporter permease [Propionibacterium freudenreichii]MDK9344611.1 metal ABC transporter permease [Propionibacterium freudenreichii]
MSVFALAFMQRALIAALLSGFMSPAVGTYIVQRKLSLLGDGLGHVAIAGVGLALLTGWAPTPVAIVICLVGAVSIELLRQSGRAPADVGLAILFYGGLATGVLLAGISGQGTGVLSQYLFGSLTTVSMSDVALVAVMAAIVIILSLGLSPQLFAVCADEEFARSQGLPVRALEICIVVMASVTVAVSMRTVGLLLVSALMVVPVAAANNLVTGFYRSMFTAIGIGVVVSFIGVTGSYYWNTASGATIVVSAIAVFALSWPVGSLLNRRRLARSQRIPDPETARDNAAEVAAHRPVDPSELVGDDGNHPRIQHGDHVDYLHGNHRHAPHGDHFDEH